MNGIKYFPEDLDVEDKSLILRLERVASQRPINSSIIPISLALRTAVRALRGPLSFADN